jgi:hypothetical protein
MGLGYFFTIQYETAVRLTLEVSNFAKDAHRNTNKKTGTNEPKE